MPLHKRKYFVLADPPKDLDPNELVYQVRFTKEIFRDYKEYLNRLNLYRQRLWTCKVTGKINMTYEEALVSEHNATEKVQQFPADLVPHVLNMIQYSPLTFTELVNEIHTDLQQNLYKGLELHARKGEVICPCTIMEVIKEKKMIRCKVGWMDKEKRLTDTSVICSDDLVRKKPPFSRSILKAFVRESTCASSPWVVHEKLSNKHGISIERPKWLIEKLSVENGYHGPNQKKRKTENEHALASKVEEPIKYPIEDLLVKPLAGDPSFTDRPKPTTGFHVPMNCVGDLLMVWNFFTSFGRLLHLWPFSLDDFENAICQRDSELMLILECHSAVLKFLIKDGGDYFITLRSRKHNLKIKLTNWAMYLCHFLEMNTSELSDHIPIIKRGHYGLLDIYVKLAILRELVTQALITNTIRDKLDECIEQSRLQIVRHREDVKARREHNLLKEGEDHTKETNGEHIMINGKKNYTNFTNGNAPKIQNGYLKANGKVRSDCSKISMENGKSKDDNIEDTSPINEQRGYHEREMEKPSIRTNCIGKDRNHNRYWFFRREGRIFVESLDSDQWGYYSTKEELDGLVDSLNVKGKRERDLKRQLEKHYVKISNALQKRSNDISQKVLLDESDLRRSARVRSQPRCGSATGFHRYINKWKERSKLSKPNKRRSGMNLLALDTSSV